MSDVVEPLILDLLEWLAPRPRPYPEVMEVWRTSCPRLPIWEEANSRALLETSHVVGRVAEVGLSAKGRELLQEHGRWRAAGR